MNTLVNLRTASNRDMREDNCIKQNSGLPVAVPDYCPGCGFFKFLEFKSKDGEDICVQCYAKEKR